MLVKHIDDTLMELGVPFDGWEIEKLLAQFGESNPLNISN